MNWCCWGPREEDEHSRPNPLLFWSLFSSKPLLFFNHTHPVHCCCRERTLPRTRPSWATGRVLMWITEHSSWAPKGWENIVIYSVLLWALSSVKKELGPVSWTMPRKCKIKSNHIHWLLKSRNIRKKSLWSQFWDFSPLSCGVPESARRCLKQ